MRNCRNYNCNHCCCCCYCCCLFENHTGGGGEQVDAKNTAGQLHNYNVHVMNKGE